MEVTKINAQNLMQAGDLLPALIMLKQLLFQNADDVFLLELLSQTHFQMGVLPLNGRFLSILKMRLLYLRRVLFITECRRV